MYKILPDEPDYLMNFRFFIMFINVYKYKYLFRICTKSVRAFITKDLFIMYIYCYPTTFFLTIKNTKVIDRSIVVKNWKKPVF